MKNSWHNETTFWYEDLEFTVGFNYTPAVPAKLSGLPEDCYEGEEEDVEYEIEGYKNELEVVQKWYADKFLSQATSKENFQAIQKALPNFLELQKQQIKKEANQLEDKLVEHLIKKAHDEMESNEIERALSRRSSRESD